MISQLVLPTVVVQSESQEMLLRQSAATLRTADLLPIVIPTRSLMSLSKLASWMNKTVNNNIITFHSSSFYNICIFTYNEYFFMIPVSWEIILQQFVAFWTQIKLACFVPPEFEVSNSKNKNPGNYLVLEITKKSLRRKWLKIFHFSTL